MSGNFTTDVDTQREYFNATYFNNSGETQNAKYDTTLLKPFFNDPNKWKLAINRMRIPLSGIPLTKNNIPFEQWEVGLSYQNKGADALIKIAYVEQLNPATSNNYNTTSITDSLQLQSINSKLNPFTVNDSENLGTTTIQGTFNKVYPAYDLYVPASPTMYVLDAGLAQINVYQGYSTIPSIISIPGWNPATSNITAFTTDINGNFYVAITANEAPTLGYNVPYVVTFLRTGISTWSEGPIYNPGTLTVNPLALNTYINSMAIDGPYLIATAQTTSGAATSSIAIGWTIGTPLYTSINTNTTYNGVSISNGTYFFGTASDGILRVYNSSTLVYTYNNVFADVFLGFDTNNNLLIRKGSNYSAFNFSNGTVSYTFTPQGGSVIIANSAPFTAPADSGKADIFTYQTFLNQINSAFLTAFNKISATYTANNGPTNPPNVIYNASTKLFSLICEGQYTESDASGNPKFQIYMNPTLYNKFFFPQSTFQPFYGFLALLIQNNGINAVVGNGSTTLPQFVNMQQEDSTIYAFYDLVRIIVGTTLIPVSGDGEGKTFSTSGFTSNNSINMITDIVPDTTTLTPGSVLIYVPSGILRWYNLYAQQPFSRIDLVLSYETKDGSIYTIPIQNGEFFSVKLEFKKGPGDF